VNFVLNPYDEFAVEEALKLKEKLGGETTVISVGPERMSQAIRSALAMGIDKAIHIKDENFPLEDSGAVAAALAEAIKTVPYDLILVGKQAVDDDNQQLTSRLAELLNIPGVSVVVKLEINGTQAIVEREVEGGKEVIEISLPAVIGAQRGLNEPRYASLKGIMGAKKKVIDVKTSTKVEPKIEILKYEYPPARTTCKKVDTAADLIRVLHEEAKVF
jgi:electron transfer flavoprotein beta subunit